MNRRVAFFFCVTSLFSSGCTVHIKPIVGKFDVPAESLSTKIAFSGVVTVLNNKTLKDEIRLGKDEGGQYYTANLHDWTQMAVVLTESALRDLGGSVGADGPKILNLSVTGMAIKDTTGGQNCTINLNVETGKEGSQDYEVTNFSTAGFWLMSRAACSGAIRGAIGDLIDDTGIRSYLEE